MLNLLLFFLFLCKDGIGPVCKCPDHTHLVFHWVVTVELLDIGLCGRVCGIHRTWVSHRSSWWRACLPSQGCGYFQVHWSTWCSCIDCWDGKWRILCRMFWWQLHHHQRTFPKTTEKHYKNQESSLQTIPYRLHTIGLTGDPIAALSI